MITFPNLTKTRGAVVALRSVRIHGFLESLGLYGAPIGVVDPVVIRRAE